MIRLIARSSALAASLATGACISPTENALRVAGRFKVSEAMFAVVAEQDIGHDGTLQQKEVAMPNNHPQPRGDLSLRTVAMPADTNPHGDIFGGWIMSLMDLAAGIAAGSRAKGRVATAAVSNLTFLQPVKVGDVVCVYTIITKTGRTSITVAVEAWALRRNLGERARVTAAEFVLVAVDDRGTPRVLPPAVIAITAADVDPERC